MRSFLAFVVALSALIALGSAPNAAPTEKRIALVIGNAGYQAAALPTSANDAGLIAQTLQAAGFDVVGARDLDQDSLRRALRDFAEKARSSGPDTVAFVYLGGYGLQLAGENYFVPVDAKVGRDTDVAAEAVRVSDYVRPLAALGLKATIVVLDAARRSPFSISGEPLAGGLALVEPSPGMLVAFNATPGTIAPEGNGPYGAYAQALAEMIREGGLPLADVFDRVRLRVHEMTRGAQVPWNASRVESTFVFFERSSEAPVASAEPDVRSRPIRDLGGPDAYVAALERDTLAGYEEFLAAYPDDPMARRVHAIIAARREAITWRRSYAADTPDAYWSYLRRYPYGPHAGDARRRLAQLVAALEPPPSFAPIDYDVPPPPPEEVQPALAFDDPDFAPPPPLPVYFLPPPPPDFVVLPPPPPPVEVFALPIPVFVPIPVWCDPPVYVAPPPDNVIFNNIHNTVVINHVSNVVTIRNQSGHIVSSAPRSAPGVAALGAPLPPSLAKRAALIETQGKGATAQPPARSPFGQPLPGGHALPPLPGKLPGAPSGGPAANKLVPPQASITPAQPPGRPPLGQPLPSGRALPPLPGKLSGAPGSGPTTNNAAVVPPHGTQPTAAAPPAGKPPLGHALPNPLPGPLGKPAVAPVGRPVPPPATAHAAAPTIVKPQPPSTHALPTALPPPGQKPLPEPPRSPTVRPPEAAAFARAPTSPAIPNRPPAPQIQIPHPPPPVPHAQPPARTFQPPPAVASRPQPPVRAFQPPPPPAYRPPPPVVRAAPPPPPAVRVAPPPPVARAAPPPPPAVRAAPPPPVARATPPPPPAVRAAPPPPVARAAPPPPPAVRVAPPPAANRAPPPRH